MNINCPHCGKSYTVTPKLAGRKVSCSNCRKAFSFPESQGILGKEIRGDEPLIDVNSSRSAARNLYPEVTSVRKTRYAASYFSTTATSIWDIFDWRFKKYLTPIIVQITWIIVVVFILLWLAGALLTQAISFVPFESLTQFDKDSLPDTLPGRLFEPKAEPIRETGNSHWDLQVFFRVAAFAATVIGALLMLLWFRVLLECIIVVFNIANTLHKIERKTKLH